MLVKISFLNGNRGVQEPPAIKMSKSRSEAVVANAKKAFDEEMEDATPDDDINEADVNDVEDIDNDYDDVLIKLPFRL